MREVLEHADRVLIGGHRGSACRYPENSIEAMEHGLLSGADYLEIDIQLTRDGVPVVYHDTGPLCTDTFTSIRWTGCGRTVRASAPLRRP